MKRTLILSLALALGFSTFNANAHEDHQTINTAPAKNNPRNNIQGPSTVYLSGGTYTYSISGLDNNFPTDAIWSIGGNPSIQFPVDTPINGTTSITFTGADFASGSTGTRFIYLIGTTADGLITIFATKLVTVYN
ncbi:hypothetical protein [Pedobacter cryoconitis]|uniref:hypothetical protein n=1 Tax=Pedobacter cryoconitis TaxID=188932 RepID=UPI0016202672|nr:hypothetical protein [Pedobacter cryoconitis]MBB5647691.1 hypothetical protein [Pedobacter cryoconitis]